jgi:hypothetical protein
MQYIYRKDEIEAQLKDAFLTRYRYARPKSVALTGILVARPEDKITQESILPHLEFWHYRSDFYTDFFCVGYVPLAFGADAKPVGVSIDNLEWEFSLRAYLELIEDIETQTTWHDNGDPCLLLANAYFDGNNAHLDFKRSIRINFREALRYEEIATPTRSADAVFEFAKLMNEDSKDPVWEFSDKVGAQLLKSGLKEAFLGLLPNSLSPTARASFQFVVHENQIRQSPPPPRKHL